MRLRTGILLTPLRARSADDGALPASLLVLPWGTNTDLDGETYIVNETTAAELAANQVRMGFEEIVLDFNHNTFAKDDAGRLTKPAEPIKVAAYGTLSVVAGEGVYFHVNSWTTEGEEHYRGGHYKDLSPVPGKNARGEVTFLHSVALCRQGQLAGLHALAADISPRTPDQPSPNNTTTMDTPATDFRALAVSLLGLEPTATEEEILAAVQARDDAAANNQPAALSADQRLDRLEKQRLIDLATAAGKIVPLSAEDLDSIALSALGAILDRINPTVPLASRTHTTATSEATALKALSPEETAVCRTLNITPEKFLAANPR